MLSYFDTKVLNILERLSNPYSDLMDNDFCTKLREPGALQARRTNALNILSWELRRVYKKPVVVLVDEYDSPMHSAIEHGYAALVRSFILFYCSYLMLFQANNFFAAVFGSLLKVCQCQRLRHRRLTSFNRTMTRCMQV
jgi:hypothetical protein